MADSRRLLVEDLAPHEVLYLLRRRHGLPQRAVAAATGTPDTLLSRYERGTRAVPVNRLAVLTTFYGQRAGAPSGVSLTDLVTDLSEAERIYLRRRRRALPQHKVAVRMGVAVSQLCRWERGLLTVPQGLRRRLESLLNGPVPTHNR